MTTASAGDDATGRRNDPGMPLSADAADASSGELSGGPGPLERSQTKPAEPATVAPTRLSAMWTAVTTATVVLILLLIFILQNTAQATVHYLGMSGTLPLGVALLLAALGGGLLVALIGTARIIQLRRIAKRRGAAAS